MTMPQTSDSIREVDAKSKEEWAYSVGLQNYVFGLPLVIFERERRLRLDPAALAKAQKFAPAAPVNQIGHMKSLATADDVMPYTPNNDTLYSGALLELAGGPVILTVPDILDRYWSVEVADCYTENLFYIGTRATGGKGGHHALVGPSWKGKLPEGVTEHRVPYDSVMFALRIGVLPEDAADLEKVRELQGKFALTSLSNWGDKARFGRADVPKLRERPHCEGELSFFKTLANLLIDNPPTAAHAAAVALLGRGGIVIGRPFRPESFDEPTRRGFARAESDGPQVMRWKVKQRGTPYPSRWNNLRPGTYGVDYLDRAAGALEGLFVHDRDEAVYFSTYEDGDGELLDGRRDYVLHFDKDELPKTQANGFWSITMYGANFQLVKNAIGRFSLGDRSRRLRYNDDGSLDIRVQSEAPKGHEDNWLPSPAMGIFRLNYRIYLPADEVRNLATMAKFIPPLRKVT